MREETFGPPYKRKHTFNRNYKPTRALKNDANPRSLFNFISSTSIQFAFHIFPTVQFRISFDKSRLFALTRVAREGLRSESVECVQLYRSQLSQDPPSHQELEELVTRIASVRLSLFIENERDRRRGYRGRT